MICPFTREQQNARMDIKRKRVGNRAAGDNQFHRGLWIISLRDEDTRAHRHAAMTPVGAMGVDPAAVTNRCEGGLRAEEQFRNRDREEGTIHTRQPQHFDRRLMRVGLGSKAETHIDDEPHAEFAQFVVIVHRGCSADEEIIGDLRIVHAGNSITG